MSAYFAFRRCLVAKAAGASLRQLPLSFARASSGTSVGSGSGATTGPVQVSFDSVAAEIAGNITKKDTELRTAYDELPASYPAHAQPTDAAPLDAAAAFRKRLLYRSKQRGWLEVDLLLGSWADANLGKLTMEQLRAYEHILNMETVDLFNCLQGKEAPPAHLPADARSVIDGIIVYVKANPIGKASPEVSQRRQHRARYRSLWATGQRFRFSDIEGSQTTQTPFAAGLRLADRLPLLQYRSALGLRPRFAFVQAYEKIKTIMSN